MKILKRILWILAIILVVIQFIPKHLPESTPSGPMDISASGNVSADVATILKTSCYDCHSNQTVLPWYSHVAPFSFLISSDVKDGRKELNFSEWNTYSKRHKIRKLGDIKEQVEKGGMPKSVYTLIHRNAVLSDEQRSLIAKWADATGNKILGE